ncbi:retrotransposon protein, putative, ty1-copia subclass [Tanacetum coccineum]
MRSLEFVFYSKKVLRELQNKMAVAAQNTNNTTIRSILLAEKLTGSNFTNWYRNLRIVLRYEKNIMFVEQPIGPAPDPKTADPDTIDKYYETVNLEQEEDGQSVSSYLLKMKSYLDTLEILGYEMLNELSVSLILNSLNKDYDQFVQNYNMHSIGKTLAELHAMLKLHEKGAKGKDKEKNKLSYAPKPKIPPPPKRENPVKDSICHHYKEVGGWRRNYPSYHAELKKRKNVSVASTSSIFTIEFYVFPNKTWVYDTAVEAIGSFDLIIPSCLIIVLDNCHFAPTITRGVVSISRLVNNSYIHTFTNYGISVLKDNVFYFNAIPRDGIYEIDMHNIYPNVSSMYNVTNKRSKHALDSSYLWHCRVGHINKKCMDKLQRDGILQPTHDESLEKCKFCISGKMARKPFPHQVERAKDLLGLIHTDVCVPFRTMSREGASYFTFTDDFSRYGFVYLMKHKHEVFETFNIFQNEVENQLCKKIKVIRFDQGGEYLSHEFVNHMKSCGYLKETMGYYFYYPLENKIFVARNAEFFENSFMVQEASGSHRLLEMSGSDKGLELIQEEDTQSSENTSKAHNEVAPIKHELWDLNKPPNYKATLAYPESDKWLEAMNTEMQSMKDNQVWYLVDLPSNDYGETFSPDADIRAIRIYLAIATFYDYEIYQMDVKTAFLNGHLSEDVYMVQPEGFVDQKHPNKVCKLQRFIYGLKQASWNKRFDEEIKKIGFTQNPNEPCVFLKVSGSNVAFLVLYVNDILLMGNNITMLQEVKSWLFKCFSMKDLGEASYILGIKIIHDRSKWLIALSQSAYLEKILKKFRMDNSKKGYTPMMEKPDYRNAKQSTSSMSSTEAEYIAAAEASMEAV